MNPRMHERARLYLGGPRASSINSVSLMTVKLR